MNSRTKGLMYPSVKFQRASCDLQSFTPVRKSDISQNEDGHFFFFFAREFYESLLQEDTKPDSNRSSSHNKRRKKSDSTVGNISKTKQVRENLDTKSSTDFKNKELCDKRQENLFLKMAQDGDVDGLQWFIRGNKVDINATDSFGWTALMCAAKNGHKACITFLLTKGADDKLQNKQGHTAKDIAKQSGHRDVFDCRRKSTRKRKQDSFKFMSPVEYTCDICKTKFFGSKHEHNTSTAHLFNCQYKSEKTFYHIPEDNIGFKLMKQKGWDKEKGLGPEGTGRKFPVKTILKQDRCGLGSKNKEKAKITHFSACDTSAVENTNDGKSSGGLRVPRRRWKKKLIQKQEEDRKWEHNLRVYMNTE